MPAANDKVRFALIGAGGMGTGDAQDILSLGGTEIAAVGDIYDGRLERAKERWGAQIFTSRDHREILARRDIDAVVVATPDHWHAQIAAEALAAGKHVYVEKPMCHKFHECQMLMDAQAKSGKILQVGSQYASALVFEKAKQLIAQGALGEVNYVESWLDRNTALGAWQYSLPGPDATPQRIDWDRFLGNAPKHPFDPIRLFRWRNYKDYGTGVSGDLFVHLLTGLHVATNSLGPNRIFATGGVRFWRDGRDAYDVVLALMDYPKTQTHPEFTFALRVNLASGAAPPEQFGLKFVGSEGTMEVTMAGVILSKTPRESEPGFTIDTFPKATQQKFLAEYRKKYPLQKPSSDSMRPEGIDRYIPPRSHNAHVEHVRNWIHAIRENKPFFEDATFGSRTAGPSLAVNLSLERAAPVSWNPNTIRLA
jgi:predicted dehydrogenase